MTTPWPRQICGPLVLSKLESWRVPAVPPNRAPHAVPAAPCPLPPHLQGPHRLTPRRGAVLASALQLTSHVGTLLEAGATAVASYSCSSSSSSNGTSNGTSNGSADDGNLEWERSGAAAPAPTVAADPARSSPSPLQPGATTSALPPSSSPESVRASVHASLHASPPTTTSTSDVAGSITTTAPPPPPSSTRATIQPAVPSPAIDTADAEASAAAGAWEPPHWLQRTTLLLGHEGVRRLRDCRVLLVGLGGVGSYVAEFLVRAGVGSLAVVDGDVVDVTNKNRQLPALDSTIGLPKAHVISKRLLEINPELNLVVRQEFLDPDGAAEQLLEQVAEALQRGDQARGGGSAAAAAAATAPAAPSEVPRLEEPRLDWVVDCIDSVAPKLSLVAAAVKRGARVVSSMGAGGRMDPLAVRIADISETYGDPFAATCRRGLQRQHGIRSGVTVVFSTEPCRRASLALTVASPFKRSYYGTISFIPALFGLQISAHIVNQETDGPMVASEELQRKVLRSERQIACGGGGGGGSGGGKSDAKKARKARRAGKAGPGGGAASGAVSSLGSKTRQSPPAPTAAAAAAPEPAEAQAPAEAQQRRRRQQTPSEDESERSWPKRGALRTSLADAVQYGSGWEGAGI